MKKTFLSFVTIGIFLVSGATLPAENFSGSDDFNDNSFDLTKWNDSYGGFEAFTEINQRLELDLDYDGGGSSGIDAHLPWKLNYGSYLRDWEVHYDVDVPTFTQFSQEESSLMGIAVYSYPPGGPYATMALEQGTDGVSYRKFIAEMEAIGNSDEIETATTSTVSSLRIRWDASATTLYCDYDSDSGADSWSNLGSWNISTGQAFSWGMTGADVFMCVLFGKAEKTHGGETNPSGDNFAADSPLPAAPLAVFRPGSGLWALRSITRVYFGGTGDLPVYSDYDGDGTKDIAIFRGASGLWAIRGITRTYFGGPTDEPVPGDYNDDGDSDIAIFREASGLWAVKGITRAYFGSPGDIPLEP